MSFFSCSERHSSSKEFHCPPILALKDLKLILKIANPPQSHPSSMEFHFPEILSIVALKDSA